jgi:hypothetical protein
MATKPNNSSMWINPRSNLHGGGSHPASYGEGHSTHNSRFFKLADIVLSLKNPAHTKAAIHPIAGKPVDCGGI